MNIGQDWPTGCIFGEGDEVREVSSFVYKTLTFERDVWMWRLNMTFERDVWTWRLNVTFGRFGRVGHLDREPSIVVDRSGIAASFVRALTCRSFVSSKWSLESAQGAPSSIAPRYGPPDGSLSKCPTRPKRPNVTFKRHVQTSRSNTRPSVDVF